MDAKNWIEYIVQLGPQVTIVVAFLYWDYKKTEKHRKEFDKMFQKFQDICKSESESRVEVINVLNNLVRELRSKPCLWEETRKKLVEDMSGIIQRISYKSTADALRKSNGDEDLSD